MLVGSSQRSFADPMDRWRPAPHIPGPLLRYNVSVDFKITQQRITTDFAEIQSNNVAASEAITETPSDTLEVAPQPNFFSGELMATNDFIQEQNYQILGGMEGQDIEALAFLVLIQSAKSAQEDLKAVMASVKAINSQKQAWRKVASEVIQQLPQTPLDAMHGQPQNIQEMQMVIQDLQSLLNSPDIPAEEKLKVQQELNQLQQLTTQDFTQALQLLGSIRSELSAYVA